MSVEHGDIGILVVDDDSSIRMILGELFRDGGFRVGDAGSPETALPMLASGQYDLVFSDINMPGMSGLQLLSAIKATREDCQVVIMTANATLDTAIEATKNGASDYLRKPFPSLGGVLELAERLAGKVRANREKQAAVGSLLDAAKAAAQTGQAPGLSNLAALAEKAERLLGLRLAPANGSRPGGAAPAAEVANELVGELADFPVPEVIQVLGMMKKTGRLEVSVRAGRAHLSVVSGNVYSASFGRARDLKAICRLVALGNEGTFHFAVRPPDSERRIEESGDWLLLEALRHMDEVRALGLAVPPPHLMIRYNGRPLSADAPPLDRTLARLLRSPMAVRDVIDAVPEMDLDVYQALIRLRTAAAIDKVNPPQGAGR